MTARIVCSGLLTGLLAASVIAAPQTVRADDAITFFSSGIDGILVDDKDQVLREALRLLDDRIEELPAQLNQPDMPGPLLKMGLEMLMSPIILRAGMLPDADPAAGPPFYAQLMVAAENDDVAAEQAMTLLQVLSQAMGPGFIAEDLPGNAGIRQIDLDGVPAYIGSTRIGGMSTFVAALNTLDLEVADIGGFELPAGVRPAMGIDIDARQLQPFIEMMLQQAPPGQAEMIRAQLAMSGMLGDNPMRITAAYGYTADRAVGGMRYANYATIPGNAAMLSREPLGAEHLALVPADAEYVQIGRTNFAALPAYIESQFAAGGEDAPDLNDGMNQIAEMTGVHPVDDLIAHLGTVVGAYMSDTTGGGGLASMVGFLEVTDEAGLSATLDTLAEFVNAIAAEEAQGMVRMGAREIDGHRVTSLTFPGLPVPLELSMTIDAGYLWIGASPGSVMAAIDHVRGGGPSIDENPRFRELGAQSADGVIGLTFTDTPRLARAGYGLVSMGLAALANGVRSPDDPTRGAELLMPSFADFMKDVRGSLTITRLDGDDLVVSFQSDRSILVNAAATAGMLGGSSSTLVGGALLAGILLPAIGKSRESARQMKSAVHLRQMHTAVQLYANDNAGRMPGSMQDLIEGDYLISELLVSPMGSPSDGGSGFWLDLRQASHEDFSANRIVGYDRAAYQHQDTLAVLFADGHVQVLSGWEFESRCEDPTNRETDFDLPSGW